MNESLNKLNCMNYQVDYTDNDGYDEFYYLQCGLRSLYNFAKRHNISFKKLCIDLLEFGQVVLDDTEQTAITMI